VELVSMCCARDSVEVHDGGSRQWPYHRGPAERETRGH
jgi:hypothetical protein